MISSVKYNEERGLVMSWRERELEAEIERLKTELLNQEAEMEIKEWENKVEIMERLGTDDLNSLKNHGISGEDAAIYELVYAYHPRRNSSDDSDDPIPDCCDEEPVDYSNVNASANTSPVYKTQKESFIDSDVLTEISFICGFVSIFTCCLCGLGFILGVIGLICGILQKDDYTGEKSPMAICGIVCSAIGLALNIVSLLYLVERIIYWVSSIY